MSEHGYLADLPEDDRTDSETGSSSPQVDEVRDDGEDGSEPLFLLVDIERPRSTGNVPIRTPYQPASRDRIFTSRSTPSLTSYVTNPPESAARIGLLKADPAKVVTTHVDVIARADPVPDLSDPWGPGMLDTRLSPMNTQIVDSGDSSFRVL